MVVLRPRESAVELCHVLRGGCHFIHSAESGLRIFSGGLRRDKYWSVCMPLFMIQIILCVILMNFQDQKGTVLIMLYISEGYAIINMDVGIASDI